MRRLAFLSLSMIAVLASLTGCGSSAGVHPTPAPPQITLSLGVSSIDMQQDGTMNPAIALTIPNAPGAVSISVSGLPNGISAQFDAASQLLSFSGGKDVPAGSYAATVTAASGTQTASQPLTVINDVVAVVSPDIDPTLGVNGKLDQFMSTSFQIAQWTGDIFGSGDIAAAREKQLTAIGAKHNRAQVIAGGMPMVANTGAAADWDFSTLDLTLQPVLASGDHSPEFQIGTAPAWMCDDKGHLLIAHADDFAAYSANLVRYYNKGGFDWGGMHFQSASTYPIKWWGIFNEYNINGLTAAEYLTLYNKTVPAMLAVDPTIKISAVELSDWGLGTGWDGDPMIALPTFLGSSGADGVNTQVDVLSTHFYGSCNQGDTDAQIFSQVPQFADNIRYFYKALAQYRPDLSSTQVWVTENNVNADFDDGTGHSTCNPGHAFVTDTRGTTAYFAAWRPYVFSQLGKVGNRALYHWAYSSDKQYGEVDESNTKYLSYWVDKTLAANFPSSLSALPPDILSLEVTDTSTIETLATRAADGTVRVMIVNRAVHSAGDNNGTGDPRTVVVELTDWTWIKSATVLTIDSSTSVSSGPKPVLADPGSRYPITLKGYGVAILTLKP